MRKFFMQGGGGGDGFRKVVMICVLLVVICQIPIWYYVLSSSTGLPKATSSGSSATITGKDETFDHHHDPHQLILQQQEGGGDHGQSNNNNTKTATKQKNPMHVDINLPKGGKAFTADIHESLQAKHYVLHNLKLELKKSKDQHRRFEHLSSHPGGYIPGIEKSLQKEFKAKAASLEVNAKDLVKDTTERAGFLPSLSAAGADSDGGPAEPMKAYFSFQVAGDEKEAKIKTDEEELNTEAPLFNRQEIEAQEKRKRVRVDLHRKARTGPLELSIVYPNQHSSVTSEEVLQDSSFVATLIEIDRCRFRPMSTLAADVAALASSQSGTSSAILIHNCPRPTDLREHDIEKHKLRQKMKKKEAAELTPTTKGGEDAEQAAVGENEEVGSNPPLSPTDDRYFDWTTIDKEQGQLNSEKKKTTSGGGGVESSINPYANVVVVELQQSDLPSTSPRSALEGMLWEALPSFFRRHLKPMGPQEGEDKKQVEGSKALKAAMAARRLLLLGPGVVPWNTEELLDKVATTLRLEQGAAKLRRRAEKKQLAKARDRGARSKEKESGGEEDDDQHLSEQGRYYFAENNVYGCVVAANRSKSLFVVSAGTVVADGGTSLGPVLDDHLGGYSAWDGRVLSSTEGFEGSWSRELKRVSGVAGTAKVRPGGEDGGGVGARQVGREKKSDDDELIDDEGAPFYQYATPPGLIAPSPYCALLPIDLVLKYWTPSAHHKRQVELSENEKKERDENAKKLKEKDWPFELQVAHVADEGADSAAPNDATASVPPPKAEFFDRHLHPKNHEGFLAFLLRAKVDLEQRARIARATSVTPLSTAPFAIRMLPSLVVGDFPGWTPTGTSAPGNVGEVIEGVTVDHFSAEFKELYLPTLKEKVPEFEGRSIFSQREAFSNDIGQHDGSGDSLNISGSSAASTVSGETMRNDALKASDGSTTNQNEGDRFLRGIGLAWDTFCLKCFGFSNEVMHYIVPLENQANVYSSLNADCFCQGTPRAFQSALKRMNGDKHFVDAFNDADDSAREKKEEEYVKTHLGQKYTSRQKAVAEFRRDVLPQNEKRDLVAFISHKDPGSFPRNDAAFTGFQKRPDIVIGRAMYEFTKTPAEWKKYKHNVDEIWVPSRFVRYVFEENGFDRDRLFILPEPIDVFQYDPLIARPLRLPIRKSSMPPVSTDSAAVHNQRHPVDELGATAHEQYRRHRQQQLTSPPRFGRKRSVVDGGKSHKVESHSPHIPVWKHASTRVVIEDEIQELLESREIKEAKARGDSPAAIHKLERNSEDARFHAESEEKKRNAFGNHRYNRDKADEATREGDRFPAEKRSSLEKNFKFLSVFKWEERKAWDVLLDAFLTEFHHGEPVSLYLVSYIYGDNARSAHKMLDKVKEHLRSRRKKAGLPYDDSSADGSSSSGGATADPSSSSSIPWPEWPNLPHIEIISEQLDEADLISLYRSVDAFVLPTRGEGWGLPIIQAMSMGLPTIATNWTGECDFMNDENSYLLNVESLEPVPGNSMYGGAEGKLWAQPSTSHLKMLMRHVVSSPKDAALKGKNARKNIVDNFSEEVVAEMVKQRLAFLRDEYWGLKERTFSGEPKSGNAAHTDEKMKMAVSIRYESIEEENKDKADWLWNRGHLIV